MLHPHLARAGLIASRLDVERATAGTSALDRVGFPAAVLSASGRVLAANRHFERLSTIFLPAAFGRLALMDAAANRRLGDAIEAAADPVTPKVRAIAVPARAGNRACVAHVVPLRHNAIDLFRSGAVMVAVTTPQRRGMAPSEDVLKALFDLTPAETRFALALAGGLSPKAAAHNLGVTESSGRTYLARIFAKTGTHRQTELMSLLQTAQPFRIDN